MTALAPRRVSWVLLVVVVAALAIGAAASILVSAASAPPPPSAPAALVYLPSWLVTIASVGVIVFFLGSLVVFRLSGGGNLSLRVAVSTLATVLGGIVFLLAVRFVMVGPSLAGAGNTTGQNQSGTTPPPPPSSGGQNFTGSGGVVTWLGVPPWVPFVVLAVVVLLTVFVAVPELRRYVSERRERGGVAIVRPEERALREVLAQASIDLRRGGDPRAVILALYASLLERLRPMVVGLDSSTPEEIRVAHLERLGVRPTAARTLTRLFEEARYSSHSMAAEAGERAQEALQAAIDDLDRRDFPA